MVNTNSTSPRVMAAIVLDRILDQVTGIRVTDMEKSLASSEEGDSGKDSSTISDSRLEEDSVHDQSDLEDDDDGLARSDEVGDICFMEHWKMERQFDKAIDGLKRLKDEPVTLAQRAMLRQPEESTSSDIENETFVISPFSENQTYTIKADCESTISPSTLAESPDDQTDEGIDVLTDNRDEDPFLKTRIKFLSVKYTSLWRHHVDIMKTKMVKARLFRNLNLKVVALQQWKEFLRRVRSEKEMADRERMMEQDTIKRYLAIKYRERNLVSKVFSAWALYSKIQSRKRKFEALTAKRETTKRKVDDFLSSLGNISKTNNEWILQKVHEKKTSTPVRYSAVSYKRLNKVKKPESKETQSSQQFPKIQNEEPKKMTKSKSKEDTTYSLQKEIINAQREKMREQWKIIESMKEQKLRLQNNRPATNNRIVRKLEKKIMIEDEINEALDAGEDTKDFSEERLEKNNECYSDCHYSDDFEEDCSSEAQSSIVPKTPEMLRKVREREKARTEKREEIRRMHQERVEQERERLRALKEKEIQEEIEERKKTREIWKKRRTEEMEKDKRKLSEKERQEKLVIVAKDFHRKLQLREYGLRPWLKLITTNRQKRLEADQKYQQKLKSSVFSSWLGLIRQEQSSKENNADNFWRKKALKIYWSSWFKTVEKEKPKKQAASDLFEDKLCSRMFSQWTEVMKQEKRRRYGLMMKAVVFHRRILLRKYFFMWVKYNLMKDSIEKTAKNIEFLRSKVNLILPDYVPGREN